jgi:hypothetical protein
MPAPKIRPLPKVDSVFTKVYNGKSYTMKTIMEDGRVKFKVENSVFDTPSGAAKYITKNPVNGWVFWGIEKKPTYPRIEN